MFKHLAKTFSLLILVIIAAVVVWQYYDRSSAFNTIRKLQQENTELQQIVERLTAEKRVARALVTHQETIDGVLHTTILFVEYGKDGNALPPRQFEVIGNVVHLDAMVIKFDHDFVKSGDPLRGHSIALFTRVYGDHQDPADAPKIDEPGKTPLIYRSAGAQVSEFESELWQNFWKLADDEQYRKEKGVRVAVGQGVWGPLEPNKLYTIALEAAGGLSITHEPLEPSFRDALKLSSR